MNSSIIVFVRTLRSNRRCASRLASENATSSCLSREWVFVRAIISICVLRRIGCGAQTGSVLRCVTKKPNTFYYAYHRWHRFFADGRANVELEMSFTEKSRLNSIARSGSNLNYVLVFWRYVHATMTSVGDGVVTFRPRIGLFISACANITQTQTRRKHVCWSRCSIVNMYINDTNVRCDVLRSEAPSRIASWWWIVVEARFARISYVLSASRCEVQFANNTMSVINYATHMKNSWVLLRMSTYCSSF